MRSIRGKVGQFELAWKSVPRGLSGIAQVEVSGSGKQGEAPQTIEVRWRRTRQTLWLELPDTLVGFDFEAEKGDEGQTLYRVSERGTDREFAGLSFMSAGEQNATQGVAGKKTGIRVRAQMPGKIVRVLVKPGAEVEKDQPLIVMEAMKMENEIRAMAAGRVSQIKVTEGQAVETGTDLVSLDPL